MTSSRWRLAPCVERCSGWLDGKSSSRGGKCTWIISDLVKGRKRFQSFTPALSDRFVAQYGGSCGVAVETAGRRMVLQLESRLRDSLERLRLRDQTATRNSAGNSNHLEAMLQQLLSAAQTQASRLTKLETSCLSGPGAGGAMNSKMQNHFPGGKGAGKPEQEVTSLQVAMDGVLAALLQAREGLEEVLGSSRQRYLPAGKISIFHHHQQSSLSVFTCCFLLLCVSLQPCQQHSDNLPPSNFLLR